MKRFALILLSSLCARAQLVDPVSVLNVAGNVRIRHIGTATTTGSSITFLSVTANAGETIVAGAVWDSNVFLAPADCLWGTITMKMDATNQVGTTAGNVSCAVMSLYVTNTDTLNLQIAFTATVGSASGFASIVDTRGFSPSADRFQTNSGTGTAPTSNATALTTQANEFVIGCIGIEGPSTDAPGTWDNLRKGQRTGTNGGGAAANTTIEQGFLELSTTTTAIAKKTGITSRDWAAAVVTYKMK